MKISLLSLVLASIGLVACESASNQPSGTGALRLDTGATTSVDSSAASYPDGNTRNNSTYSTTDIDSSKSQGAVETNSTIKDTRSLDADADTGTTDIEKTEISNSNSNNTGTGNATESGADSKGTPSTNLRSDSSGNTGSPIGSSTSGTGYGTSGASNSSVPTPNGPARYENSPSASTPRK